MQNTNTFGVHFILRRNKSKDGVSPIHARIAVNSSRVEMSLKITIPNEDWNEGKGNAKPKNKTLKSLNTTLEEIRSKFVIVYQNLVREGGRVTAELVKNCYLGIGTFGVDEDQKKDVKTLLWLIQEHNRVMTTVLQPGTLKNYYSTEKYVKQFLIDKLQVTDLPLEALSYAFLTDFEYYVRTTPIKAGDPCTTNGVMKHIERLKKMSAWAEKNEWLIKDPFIKFELKFKQVKTEFLELSELRAIEAKKFTIPMLEAIRKMFIFSCYSGLSYGDVMSLSNENIVQGTEGFKWIKHTRAKTDICFSVPLLPVAEEMLNQFDLVTKGMDRCRCFPLVSNQEMNRGLKIIGEVCGIQKQLTFHLARHTFATTVTLANDVPIESISKMMGHTKITTTMIYAKVVDSKIAKDMTTLHHKLMKQECA